MPEERTKPILPGTAHTDYERYLRTDELLELPGSAPGIGRQYLRGVTKGALIVLDGAILLQDDRLVIDQGDGD